MGQAMTQPTQLLYMVMIIILTGIFGPKQAGLEFSNPPVGGPRSFLDAQMPGWVGRQ